MVDEMAYLMVDYLVCTKAVWMAGMKEREKVEIAAARMAEKKVKIPAVLRVAK